MKKPPKTSTPTTNPSAVSVTGRDGYILTKALAYAIEAIRALPERQREESDADDMQALLEHFVPSAKSRNHIFTGVLDHMDAKRLFPTGTPPTSTPRPRLRLV